PWRCRKHQLRRLSLHAQHEAEQTRVVAPQRGAGFHRPWWTWLRRGRQTKHRPLRSAIQGYASLSRLLHEYPWRWLVPDEPGYGSSSRRTKESLRILAGVACQG